MARIPIAAARVAKGMTQADLARKIGVSRELINILENNPSKMTPYYFYAILYVTGFNVDDIILPEGLILN